MNRYVTKGIVLARTNFGEADRIITFLTPDRGKVRAMAKGVRKSQSKLAGGIELFSISELTILVGKGEIQTLMSARLARHYGNIVKEVARTQAGYEFIKLTNKATEEAPERAYFNLLKKSFEALDNDAINSQLIEAWFGAQLLRLGGRSFNLRTDNNGAKLEVSKKYDFDPETMGFKSGRSFNADQIKYLRLLFSDNQPARLQKVQGTAQIVPACAALISHVVSSSIKL